MSDLNENMIRERAQWLWHQAGSPEGQDLDFWLQAERDVAAEAGDLGSSDDEPRHEQPEHFAPAPFGSSTFQ